MYIKTRQGYGNYNDGMLLGIMESKARKVLLWDFKGKTQITRRLRGIWKGGITRTKMGISRRLFGRQISFVDVVLAVYCYCCCGCMRGHFS